MAEHSGGVASLPAEFLMTTDPSHVSDTCPSLVTCHKQGHEDHSSHVLRYPLGPSSTRIQVWEFYSSHS